MTARTVAAGTERDVTAVSVLFNPLVKQQHARVDRGTRWGLWTSTVLHALFFIWFTTQSQPAPDITPITEITYVESGDPDAAAPARPGSSAAAASAPGELAPGDQDVHFKRETREADLRFDRQSPDAIQDRLNARLAAIQGESGAPNIGVVSSSPPTLWGSSPATVSGAGTSGTSPVSLKRGGEGTAPAPALELTRGGHGAAPALVATPAPPEREQAPAPAKSSESVARRTIAGVTLMGPIADRAILSHPTPVYPEWAKRDAVEGAVTLYFVVRADGTVKENILVQKTAGFEDFDESARAALAAWRFEPLRDGAVGEQWGNITFRFRLRGGA